MAYVIRRVEDGKYVAPAGSKKSYVRSLQSARLFTDPAEALRECCDNEVIVAVVSGDGR